MVYLGSGTFNKSKKHLEQFKRKTYTNALCWPPFCKKTSLPITFELRHLGWRFWHLDLCFWGQGIRWCLLFWPMTLTRSWPLQNHILNHISVTSGQNIAKFEHKVAQVKAFKEIKKYLEWFGREMYANALVFSYWPPFSQRLEHQNWKTGHKILMKLHMCTYG